MNIENTAQVIIILNNAKVYLESKKELDTENLIYKINELIKLCGAAANTDTKECDTANLTVESLTEQIKEVFNYFNSLTHTTANRTIERCAAASESILKDMYKLPY